MSREMSILSSADDEDVPLRAESLVQKTRRLRSAFAQPGVYMSWQWAFVAISILKLFFVAPEAYHSTDFEVHRNWLAITHQLPLNQWYHEARSEWTLDYPPLFAYFERFLSFFCWDAQALQIDNLQYTSHSFLLFHRLTVVLFDAFLVHACHIWAPGSEFLVALNPGLLIVDHMHFQYNGFLTGLLFLSAYEIAQRRNLRAAALFVCVFNLKHIFLYVAPVYFFILLVIECHERAGEPIMGGPTLGTQLNKIQDIVGGSNRMPNTSSLPDSRFQDICKMHSLASSFPPRAEDLATIDDRFARLLDLSPGPSLGDQRISDILNKGGSVRSSMAVPSGIRATQNTSPKESKRQSSVRRRTGLPGEASEDVSPTGGGSKSPLRNKTTAAGGLGPRAPFVAGLPTPSSQFRPLGQHRDAVNLNGLVGEEPNNTKDAFAAYMEARGRMMADFEQEELKLYAAADKLKTKNKGGSPMDQVANSCSRGGGLYSLQEPKFSLFRFLRLGFLVLGLTALVWAPVTLFPALERAVKAQAGMLESSQKITGSWTGSWRSGEQAEESSNMNAVSVFALRVVGGTIAEGKQIVSRLFPFGRGLTHAYWAPNVWALYNFADRVLAKILRVENTGGATSGLVEVYKSAVLPSITPPFCLSLVLAGYVVAIAVALQKYNPWPAKQKPGRQANTSPFALRDPRTPPPRVFEGVDVLFFLAIGSAIAFELGWHVHEKAILMTTLPLQLFVHTKIQQGRSDDAKKDSLLEKMNEGVSASAIADFIPSTPSRPKLSAAFLQAYLLLTVVATLTVMPLIPVADRLGSCTKWLLLFLFHGADMQFLGLFPQAWWTKLGCALSMLFAFYNDSDMNVLLFGAKWEFIPLMLLSIVNTVLVGCALLILIWHF
ncbi:unnamed protein product [Amoebophrya sp. A25]|nr:unnamed protein product [Amoebophrya sp. A25]|eukprot:GSA25T00013497001.1